MSAIQDDESCHAGWADNDQLSVCPDITDRKVTVPLLNDKFGV